MKNIFMILAVFLLSSCLFSFAVLDDFEDAETYRISTYKITTDDGESIILKQYDNIEAVWVCICGYYSICGRPFQIRMFSERDNKLIGTFWFWNYLFKEHEDDYVWSIKKIKDCQNVTLYEFSLTYTYEDNGDNIDYRIGDFYNFNSNGDRVTYRLKFWIDKNTGAYSGSPEYTPIDLNTFSLEGDEYYKAIQDALVDVVHQEFDNFNLDFEQDKPHKADPYLEGILKWITNYDSELASELQAQLGALESKSSEIQRNHWWLEGTKNFLTWFSSPVSVLQEELKRQQKIYKEFIADLEVGILAGILGDISEIDKIYMQRLFDAPERPEVAGEFPVNEQELEAYKAWALIIFAAGHDFLKQYDMPHDLFGTPIKFELVDGGVKATSAGLDREFGTDDDMVYINGVEQTK